MPLKWVTFQISGRLLGKVETIGRSICWMTTIRPCLRTTAVRSITYTELGGTSKPSTFVLQGIELHAADWRIMSRHVFCYRPAGSKTSGGLIESGWTAGRKGQGTAITVLISDAHSVEVKLSAEESDGI